MTSSIPAHPVKYRLCIDQIFADQVDDLGKVPSNIMTWVTIDFNKYRNLFKTCELSTPESGISLPSFMIQLLMLSRRRRSTSLCVARRVLQTNKCVQFSYMYTVYRQFSNFVSKRNHT